MRLFATILFAVFYLQAHCQELNDFLVMDYTFDNCAFDDATGLHDAAIVNNPSCVCGVGDVGLEFTQTGQEVFLPSSANSFLSEDFTLSFYLQIRNTGNLCYIMSLAKDNSIDSTMTIRYLPDVEKLSVQLSESASTFIEMAVPLDVSKCWNHFVLTRDGADYYVYINGELQGQKKASRPLHFYQDTSIVIASNTYVGQQIDVFRGRIDNLQLFSSFSGKTDISKLYKKPDQILNQDTVLFAGDDLQIALGPTCAASVFWSPGDGVSSTSAYEPLITPFESTTYTVRLGDSFCSEVDTIRINVVNTDELDCQKVLLPNAFTPNGDGLNDTYFISNEFLVDELMSFEIYDRWGQKVFETISKSDSWDGSFKNKSLNPGMFLYKIRYKCQGQEYSIANNFSLIR